MFFGRCYTTGIPKPLPAYYLVTLDYTPSTKTTVKSFTTPSSEWAKVIFLKALWCYPNLHLLTIGHQFVDDSYANKKHQYDIVEGPYSRSAGGKKVGAMQQDGQNMLWQGIFIGPEALKTLTVTARGQVTFRKDVLEHLGIKPGGKIRLDLLPNGRAELKADRPTGSWRQVFGLLRGKGNGSQLSIEGISDAIAEAGS